MNPHKHAEHLPMPKGATLTPKELQEQIGEMMDNWNRTHVAIKHLFPDASDEEQYQKTKAAFNLSIELAKERLQ